MSVSLYHNDKIEKRKSIVFFRQTRGYRFSELHIKMPCHSEIGQSKSLFLLTVALLCFQAKKLPFSDGNGHSDRHAHCEFFLCHPFPGSLSVIWNN